MGLFSFVTRVGVCVCVVGCNGERENFCSWHACGQSMEEDLGAKLLSKLSALWASWRVNLKSPERSAQFGEAC